MLRQQTRGEKRTRARIRTVLPGVHQVRDLIMDGAKVDEQDQSGWTPLMRYTGITRRPNVDAIPGQWAASSDPAHALLINPGGVAQLLKSTP